VRIVTKNWCLFIRDNELLSFSSSKPILLQLHLLLQSLGHKLFLAHRSMTMSMAVCTSMTTISMLISMPMFMVIFVCFFYFWFWKLQLGFNLIS